MIIPLILSILVVLGVGVLATGYYLQRVALFPHRYTREESIVLQVEAGHIQSFDEIMAWSHYEIALQSPGGYELRGLYFPFEGSKKTVIFSHGITLTLFGSAKYMPIFRRLGYNLLVYDNRFHGLSGGPNCSFGFLEKHDLKTVVDWAVTQIGSGGIVGTHGESLGGSIALQHAAIDSRISFVIADCAYSDLWQLFKHRLANDYHLPPFPILHIASLIAKALAGFSFSQVSPIQDITAVKTPVLFIHGEKDGYILPLMSKELYTAKKAGLKRLYIVPGAKHAEAYKSNPAEYERQVATFLDEVNN